MRAFVGVDFPEEIHAALAEQQAVFREACKGQALADGVRWTRPEGIHLTLKFLGQVPEDKIALLTASLEPLGQFEPFRVEVKGFGFFPSAQRPRVFWVGIDAPQDLGALVSRVEDATEGLGYAHEQRAFTPHLTLARFESRPPAGFESLLKEREGLALGKFRVSEFFLFESKLSPRGAEYRKVARFPKLKT